MVLFIWTWSFVKEDSLYVQFNLTAILIVINYDVHINSPQSATFLWTMISISSLDTKWHHRSKHCRTVWQNPIQTSDSPPGLLAGCGEQPAQQRWVEPRIVRRKRRQVRNGSRQILFNTRIQCATKLLIWRKHYLMVNYEAKNSPPN